MVMPTHFDELVHHSRMLARCWAAHATDAIEVPGLEPTWRQVRGPIEHFSTLDHVCCVARELDLLALRLEVTRPCSAADLRIPSDLVWPPDRPGSIP